MKRKILALGVVLVLVAVMALPMAVFADTGTTTVTGSLGQIFTLLAPSSFSLGSGGAIGIGPNAGSAATAGSVITNAAHWTLTVSDTKTNKSGRMTISGLDAAGSTGLADYIQVGMTAPAAGNIATSIGDYSTALGSAGGYGTPGTFSIPLYANQTVVGTDASGSYSISLTYVGTPAF